MGFLTGKRLLITGVLSNRSIAYGIARACHREGAELAFSYVGERFKGRVAEFAADFNSTLLFDCDVADDAQIDAMFSQLGEAWPEFDGFVHSIGFATRESIAGDFLDRTIKPEAYDLALANKLLDDAGYPKGADGIRVTPSGDRMSYDVILPSDTQGQQRKFEIIQGDWQKIGIEVNSKPMDAAAAWDDITAPDGKYLNYDIHMWSWIGYIDPDFMLTTVMCNQYGNWSDTGYCNPEYDALYAKQATEMDPVKRQAIVHEMQQILYRDHPYIFVAQSEFIRAYKGAWGGITPPYLVYVSKLPWDTIGRTQ